MSERMFLVLNFDYATQSLPVYHSSCGITAQFKAPNNFIHPERSTIMNLRSTKYMLKEGNLS